MDGELRNDEASNRQNDGADLGKISLTTDKLRALVERWRAEKLRLCNCPSSLPPCDVLRRTDRGGVFGDCADELHSLLDAGEGEEKPDDEPRNPLNAVCGNCGKSRRDHYAEQSARPEWLVYFCYKNTNGDVFTDDPSDALIMDYLRDKEPSFVENAIAAWKKANGHI